jgi:putative ABC transport system permease protein
MSDILRANRYVGAFAGLAQGDGVTVDGQPVDVGGIDEIEGFVSAPIVAGRAPRAADEIALARDTLGQLHRHVGDVVTVGVAARHVRMRIVGQALVPTAGGLLPKLSSGGIVTIAGLQRVEPDAPALQFAVRYRHGADRRVAFASLTDAFGREVLEPFPGGEIGDLATVDFLPAVLAGVLVVLAAGGLVLMLLGSVRSHRRDLAVLETIGFVRRQVSATVAWQATALALTAIVVGVPCGIALGRLTWRLVAHSVGSVSPAIVPVTGVLLVAPVALVAANVLAGAPAWRAGRTRPNVVLRAE